MIKIIEGAKGTGKTKKIIETANYGLGERKGDTVFLSTTTRYRTEIKPQIKFIDAKGEGIVGKEMLFGFIKGMLAANYDIEYIFIDGVYKIMGVEIDSARRRNGSKLCADDKLREGKTSVVHSKIPRIGE